MTLEVIGGHALFVPLTRYKGREVRLRNPNHPPDPVCNKEPVVNPAPYRAEETSRRFAMSLMVKKRGEAGMVTPPPKTGAATAP